MRLPRFRGPPIKRRTFLRRGLFGGAVLLLGGIGLGTIPTRDIGQPRKPLLVLTPRTFQVLAAIASRVTATADPITIAHDADSILVSGPPEVQTDIVKVLGLFENALPGFLLDGRVMPFTRLAADDQDRALLAWRDSSLALRRGAYHALRKLCIVARVRDPAAFAEIGYTPPQDLRSLAYDDSRDGSLL